MKALFVAFVCAGAVNAGAAGVTLDAAVAAPIHQFIDSFDKGDIKGAEAAHVSDPVIIDEFAPHQWQGHDSFKAWVDDLDKHDKAAGVTDGAVKLGDAIRQEIDGDRAYVVMWSDYLFKQNGASMKAAAQMTFALRKEKGGWRISGWTYSGPAATAVTP